MIIEAVDKYPVASPCHTSETSLFESGQGLVTDFSPEDEDWRNTSLSGIIRWLKTLQLVLGWPRAETQLTNKRSKLSAK